MVNVQRLRNTRRTRWVAFGLLLAAFLLITDAGLPNPLRAQSLDYTVRETLPLAIPSGHGVLAVRDMDGDGVLDVVLIKFDSPKSISILERSGSTFVTRATIPEVGPPRVRA